MSNRIQIQLPWPPSVNGYWRSFAQRGKDGKYRVRQIISERGREYRDKALLAALEQTSVGFTDGDLEVWEEFYPPTLRSYDLDNFRKAYRDALTHAGVWGDDSQIVEDHGKKCAKDKDNPRVVVTIERKGQA